MPLNEPHRIQTRSSTNRELYETISALFSNSKLDFAELLAKQNVDGEGDSRQRDVLPTPPYFKALLGLNSDPELSTPNSALKTKSGSSLNRPRSVSFSNPEVRDGFVRGAGLNSDSSNNSVSPIRMRSHASEAGSPTLEQALLMGRDSPGSDAGYGSFQSGTADLTSLSVSELRRGEEDSLSPTSRPGDRSFSPGEPRPTLATLFEADLAVAQAVQNLQELKDRQAAIYQEVGVLNPLVKDSGLLSAILTATQGNRQTDYSGSVRDEAKRERTPLSDSTFFDREIRDNMDRDYLDPRDHLDRSRDPLALERAARQYRNAASVHEASCTWNGQLPPKQPAGRQSSFSSKIFLGGVPWDITENSLIQAFVDFGPVRVEWPGREAASPPRGYLYIVFEDEDRVKDLLANCTHDYSNGGSYYFKISSKKRGSKEIQIIPWLVADSNYVRFPSPRLDPKKTVFVGALHGMINAQSLAVIFNDLFGGVVYAGLDTDKHKYPIGSGRVTFNNSKSYMKAVAAAFIEIKTPRFCKKVQVDPYLEDALCSVCHIKQGPYFCRDLVCFNYYCRSCWDQQHSHQSQHKPLMRNIRGLTRARLQDLLPGSNDCFTPLYQTNRDTKIFMDLWEQADQDKRSEMDNWRTAACLDKADSWRNSSFDKQNECWRTLPEITWRNPEKFTDGSDMGWPTHTGEMAAWGEDYANLASTFTDSLSINSERKSGFRPFFDRDPPTSSRTGLVRESNSFRAVLGGGGDSHTGYQQHLQARDQAGHHHPEPTHYLLERSINNNSFQSIMGRDEAGLDPCNGLHRLLDRDQYGLRPFMEKEEKPLRSLIEKDQVKD